jgi:hypothetical protein
MNRKTIIKGLNEVFSLKKHIIFINFLFSVKWYL